MAVVKLSKELKKEYAGYGLKTAEDLFAFAENQRRTVYLATLKFNKAMKQLQEMGWKPNEQKS